MKEHPILFSAPMIRALLAGTKTQTRRPVLGTDRKPTDYVVYWDQDGVPDPAMWRAADGLTMGYARCPFGYPGDHLWVRESFCENYFGDMQEGTSKHGYRADWTRRAAEVCPEPRWTPSIHMPRRASRITLEVTDVRVERLNAISEKDARTEGIREFNLGKHGSVFGVQGVKGADVGATAVEAYSTLWDSINAKRAPWSSNPWVWAVSFKRVTA